MWGTVAAAGLIGAISGFLAGVWITRWAFTSAMRRQTDFFDALSRIYSYRPRTK